MEPVHFMGHITSFWLWALDNIPDGELDGISPRMIARAAQWEGEPEDFMNALIEAGFIDKTDDGLIIHDWYDYAGKLVERRIAERERSRQRRVASRKKKKDDQTATNGRPTDDQKKTVGTVPNRTVPNSTNNKEYICAPDQPNNQPEENEDGRAAGQDSGEEQPDEQRARNPFQSLKQEKMFDTFWEIYPKKRSKGRAERAWVKIKPDEQLFKAILDGLERAKTSVEWLKDDGQYIPYPSSWLNAKGWEDELEVNTGAKHQGHNTGPAAFGGTRAQNDRFAGLVRDGGTGIIAGQENSANTGQISAQSGDFKAGSGGDKGYKVT